MLGTDAQLVQIELKKGETLQSEPGSMCYMSSNVRSITSVPGRGLHSSTFRLNLCAFYGIGVHVGVVEGVFRRCQWVLRSCRGCSGCPVSEMAQVELRSG